MDLSSACDIHCFHCWREAGPVEPMKVSRDQLGVLERDVFPFIENLSLSCVGEPLIVSLFPQALQAAKRAGVPYIRIQSNATHLDEEASGMLLDNGLTQLGVSMDAAHRESFNRIRAGADWDVVTENIKQFVRMRNERGRVDPEVSINFTLMQENCQEAVELFNVAKDLGVSSLSFHHMVVESEDTRHQNLCYDPALANKIYAQLRDESQKTGIAAYIPADLPDKIEPFSGSRIKDPVYHGVCRAAEGSWVFITPNGNCYPCLNLQGRGPLGNIYETPFSDIWYQDRNQSFRGKAIDNHCVNGCDNCKAVLDDNVKSELAFLAPRLTVEPLSSDGPVLPGESAASDGIPVGGVYAQS